MTLVVIGFLNWLTQFNRGDWKIGCPSSFEFGTQHRLGVLLWPLVFIFISGEEFNTARTLVDEDLGQA